MNRLQKKCFFASAALHLLLFVLLIVGPAFLSSRNRESLDLPLLSMIPTKLIDEAAYGGGAPAAASPAAIPPPPSEAPKQPVVQTPAHNPEPAPIPPRPIPKPAVVETPVETTPKIKPATQAKNQPEPAKPDQPLQKKNRKAKPDIEPDLKPAVRGAKANSPRKAKEDEAAQAQAQARAAQEAWKKGLAKSVDSLRGNLSSTTTIESVGTGGEAYANYGQAVKTVYTEAWITPDDVTDERATVQVSVTIARNGRVLSSSILKRSGISSLDKSIQSVLDRVTKLPPFPEGAKDFERTFKLNFNLKAKRSPG